MFSNKATVHTCEFHWTLPKPIRVANLHWLQCPQWTRKTTLSYLVRCKIEFLAMHRVRSVNVNRNHDARDRKELHMNEYMLRKSVTWIISVDWEISKKNCYVRNPREIERERVLSGVYTWHGNNLVIEGYKRSGQLWLEANNDDECQYCMLVHINAMTF